MSRVLNATEFLEVQQLQFITGTIQALCSSLLRPENLAFPGYI